MNSSKVVKHKKGLFRGIREDKPVSDGPDMFKLEIKRAQTRHQTKNKPSMPKMPWENK